MAQKIQNYNYEKKKKNLVPELEHLKIKHVFDLISVKEEVIPLISL